MKNTLRKIIAALLCLAMVFAFAACSGNDTNTNTPSGDNGTEKALKIGIIQYASNPSLDNCCQGIINTLEKSGLNYTVDRQIGSDNAPDSDCASFASTMVAQKYDMIYAIATPAATAAYAATEGTDIPVIFCAVSDPVAAKLVETTDVPGGLCTGTSDVLDLASQVDVIQAMQPDVKSIGILYTTSEPNSITQLGLLKEVCEKRNITVEATGIQNDADIPAAASALAKKVDCINNFTDNKVVLNLSVVLDAANEAKIPVYGSEEEQVKNGCLASASIDYVDLGEVTGQMGVDVIGGEDISKMAVKTFSDTATVVNTDVLASLGMTMPESLSDAQTVTTAAK